jgi:single stranded DNA-binding protein
VRPGRAVVDTTVNLAVGGMLASPPVRASTLLTISGNLTRGPTSDLRVLPTGQAVCDVRIAHNERRRTSTGEWTDHAQCVDVTIWSGLGEWVAHNLTQGAKVVIGGRLRWRQYTTSDGAHRQAVDITADSIVPMRRTTTTEPTPEEIESGRDDFDDDIAFRPPAWAARSTRTGRPLWDIRGTQVAASRGLRRHRPVLVHAAFAWGLQPITPGRRPDPRAG